MAMGSSVHAGWDELVSRLVALAACYSTLSAALLLVVALFAILHGRARTIMVHTCATLVRLDRNLGS